MSTQPNDLGDPAARRDVAQRTSTRLAPVAESTPRSFRPATMQRCPNCGERNHSHASICATCGENLRIKPSKIRCRHCGNRGSSILIVCPNCGRELQPAPSRWLLWAAPTALVLLFLGALIGQGSVLRPLQWAQNQVNAGINWVWQIGENLDPQFSIEGGSSEAVENPLPVAQAVDNTPPAAPPANDNANAAAGASISITSTQVVSETANLPVIATDTPLPLPTATQPATVAPTVADTPTTAPTATASSTPSPTNSPAPSPTASSTSSPTTAPTRNKVILVPTPTVAFTVTVVTVKLITPTQNSAANSKAVTATPKATATRAILLLPTNTPPPTPTDTATNTPIPLPTATPTAVPPTPTPVQRTYTVQSGDTLSEIADSFNISLAALMAANGVTDSDVYILNLGDVLVIPGGADSPAAPAVANAPTPTATVPPRTYALQTGDTPGDIAERFGVSVDALLAANGLTREDARSLRTGQVLIIPGATASTSLPPAAEVSNALAPSSPGLRLNAPQLRSPENNNQISCTGSDKLIWLPVDFVLADDLYMLHLGFVSGVTADGKENITWVLEQAQPANNTLWNPDPSLCSLAPQEFGRKWYWYVEVVEGRTRAPVSPPSPLWSFRWN